MFDPFLVFLHLSQVFHTILSAELVVVFLKHPLCSINQALSLDDEKLVSRLFAKRWMEGVKVKNLLRNNIACFHG